MSVGWGFRGDYGHEAGAMVPGALLGLSICLASGRRDWWHRSTIMAMCGAVGWAFGGQMSYGRIIGYTASSSLPDVAYGYGCLFLIVMVLSGKPSPQPEVQIASSDQFWKSGMRRWISWLLIPALIGLLAYLTVSSHDEPMPGSHLCFTKNLQQ